MVAYLQGLNIFIKEFRRQEYVNVCDEILRNFIKLLINENKNLNPECLNNTIELINAKKFLFMLFAVKVSDDLSDDQRTEIINRSKIDTINILVRNFLLFSCKDFHSLLSHNLNESERKCFDKFAVDNKLVDVQIPLRSINDNMTINCDEYIETDRLRKQEIIEETLNLTRQQRKCFKMKSNESKFYETLTRLIVLNEINLSETEKLNERVNFDMFLMTTFENALSCLESF
ncbi:CLUMA_CG003539, isoform A [Clunio marinus]|uniref:CLUMA_CG003539, isoform A n=1 Tax=Clunio marinus TaxID=568069 RepID=A0A1J1HQI7_9DIPT|nr:CLUMA_CG003539, isoform A [Clunio marinus]